MVGPNLPPLVGIGLTELPNSGWAKAHPAHPLAASLNGVGIICPPPLIAIGITSKYAKMSWPTQISILEIIGFKKIHYKTANANPTKDGFRVLSLLILWMLTMYQCCYIEKRGTDKFMLRQKFNDSWKRKGIVSLL